MPDTVRENRTRGMSEPIAVFVDLQGTLGGEGSDDILAFSFYPSAKPAIKLLNEAGLPVIVVTHQSHIAKGHFTQAEFDKRMDRLRHELAVYGAKLDAVYCCPHAEGDDCPCRKPLPGMLLQAQRDFGFDLENCYVVGDVGDWDMALARSVGCKAVLVRTGFGEGSLGAYRHTWADIDPDFVALDVLDAARWILASEGKGHGAR